SDADDYVNDIVAQLRAAGLRAEADTRNEKINYKIREHSVGKVPVIFAVGMKEVAEGTVSIRRLGATQSEILSLQDAVAAVAAEAVPPDLR
ncbi:MAG: His/Gly/Thr/Pro-type tRNA ligase C-terminal domain-containing protein, partial [Albidovulum sp.]